MNYELATQLRDAGFPQEVKQGEMLGRMRIPDMNCYAPTLSELIEACDPIADFTLERRFVGGTHNNTWVGRLIRRTAHNDGIMETEFKCEDNTPEEAVARLWLALKRNTISDIR